MVRSATLLLATLDFLLLLAISGCGGSSMMNSNNIRQLQSLTVTPASADARNFPNGQVQFTSTGTFNMAPMTVMSPPVLWSVGNPSFMSPMPMAMSAAASSGASISSSGLGQCNGFTGIATIEATAPADPNVPISQMNAMMKTLSAQAQMTCP